MNPEITEKLRESVRDVHLPRFKEVPNMGLYLEQVTKYVNGFLSTCGIAPITPSMVSNYVKLKIIPGPTKKTYNAETISYLIFLSCIKGVMSMDDIRLMIDIQKESYDEVVAYDYFCREFENLLQFVHGNLDEPAEVGNDHTQEKELLRMALFAIAHKIYLDHYLEIIRKEKESSSQ